MSVVTRAARGWHSVPAAASLLAVLLLVMGLGIIFQNERNYQGQQLAETQVQAEILAASVTAPLDFGDPQAAQESVDALRVNRRIESAAVFDTRGTLLAGFNRRGGPPAPHDAATAGDTIAATAPVAIGNREIGAVRLTIDREPLARRLNRYSIIGLFVVMAALVAGVLGIAHTVLQRINRELEERAAALAEVNRQLQVQIEERAKAEEQLRQAQKMQALGQLTGGIAHDFNNLLTVIQGSADILKRPELPEDKRLRFATAISDTAARAAALTAQLLAFARRQPLKPEVIDLSQKIAGMADLLDRTLGERVEVRTELAPDCCLVEADPAQLEAAILNIAVNARDAMPHGGALTIRTAAAQLDDGPAVALSMSDNGQGMDAETLERVFEPFFTTKTVGKGTGLGLSQVYGFANQSGGRAEIASMPGQGSTITILLPCSASRTATAVPPAAEQPVPRTVLGRVLVVDDNEEVGSFAETLLTELGHTVLRARGGEEALALAKQATINAVFTDVVMPGMSGLELAERLGQLYPDLPVVLTTGFSDEIARAGTGGLPVVYKPYRLETVAAALEHALTNHRG